MSKRRNAKKEKAERNKLNARKFRKTTSRYAGKGRRYNNTKTTKTQEGEDENESSSSDSTSNR